MLGEIPIDGIDIGSISERPGMHATDSLLVYHQVVVE
jgi:hypothetical protein